MLISRDLDDQRFEDIVREAEGRLPWLCPVWTDHNAHDPGITILELMAWFKETQQYEMNRVGPETERRLLELAGLRIRPERPAECALEIPPEAPPRPWLSPLETEESVVFELAEEIPERRAVLRQVLVRRPGEKGEADVTGMLAGGSVILPFAFGGRAGSLLTLVFSALPERELRLWFDVQEPAGVRRNEPDVDTELPRTLVWRLEGAGELTPLRDETLALSRSGYVTLPLPAGAGNGPFRLTLEQKEGGCEEAVRLTGISAGRYRAVQTQSRARAYPFTVKPGKGRQVSLPSAQAREADPAVFLREAEGWRQVADFGLLREAAGLTLTLDAGGAAEDGEENLLVACLDPIYTRDLLFDAKGRPGESFRLNLGGKGVLTESFTLMCQTLYPDGVVRPAPWRCVEDLSLWGPRDRVFTYDRRRETVTVGDGAHGALIAPGPGAVLVAQELISLCGEGNIPAAAGLRFAADGELAVNAAARGGCDAETVPQARGRLLHRLEDTRKCVSVRDYERAALRTPGLRVAGAKALPGYDPHRQHQRTAARVSVAVLPAGEGETPTPDGRFLAAVSRQLERSRSVCVRAEAIPVRYGDFTVSARLRVEQSFSPEGAKAALGSYFAPGGERIGAGVSRDELAALLQKLPGVLQIDRVELRSLDQNSHQTGDGGLSVMPDTILHLRSVTLEPAKDRR